MLSFYEAGGWITMAIRLKNKRTLIASMLITAAIVIYKMKTK